AHQAGSTAGVYAADNGTSAKTIERHRGVFGASGTPGSAPPGAAGSSFSDRVRRAHLSLIGVRSQS
ncbi:hypothetical protein, partial [Micromonospora palomenae]|uniref:hypothetical protein n=1 Tax=Micromonospora palomenae TaxID=1461247 RepID=UPI003F8A69B0